MISKKVFLLLFTIVLFSFYCTPSVQVVRSNPKEVIDLDGTWNDTDSRLVAEEMSQDMMERPWLKSFQEQNKNRKPILAIGPIKNQTTEYISPELFSNDITRNLINLGKVRFVATSNKKKILRKERTSQEERKYIDVKYLKQEYKELGADFYLLGSISSQEERLDRKKLIFYQVDLELINLETNETVWLGSKKIKKQLFYKKYKF